MEEKEILTLTPYDNFMYALKAEATKRQFPNRLDRFLTFVEIVIAMYKVLFYKKYSNDIL